MFNLKYFFVHDYGGFQEHLEHKLLKPKKLVDSFVRKKDIENLISILRWVESIDYESWQKIHEEQQFLFWNDWID